MTTNETRRLYRSQSQRMIGGVCGGLGDYLSVDPTLIHLLFVAAAILGGHGVLLYLVLLLLVPIEPSPSAGSVPPTSA